MQSFVSSLRQAAILRQPAAVLNMSKRLAWRWVVEPTDNDAMEPEQNQHFKSRNILTKNSKQLDKDSNLSTKMNSSNIVEALRGEFLAEIGAVKTDNSSLLAKLDSLQVRNDGLLDRLDTMEQKLKVPELETKLLVKKEVNDLIMEKITEVTAQLREEFGKEEEDEEEDSDKEEEDSDEEEESSDNDEDYEPQLLETESNSSLLANNREMQARLETMEQKLKVAELETKLAKREMHSLIAEKMAEAVNGDRRKKEEQDEANWSEKVNNAKKNYSIEVDGNNHWNTKNCGQVSFNIMNRLTVTSKLNDTSKFASVRSMKPFSLVTSNLTRVFYFEVLAKQLGHFDFGLSGPDFPVENDNLFVGQYPGSYSYCTSGRAYGANIVPTSGYEQIVVDDTVGCGLIQVANDKLKIFFTKNGLFNGKSLLLPFAPNEQKLFYPTVTLQYKSTIVEANFGADLFKYNFAGLGAVIDA